MSKMSKMSKTSYNNWNIWKILIGLLFILGGGVFILANMGIISADASLLFETYWPLLVILASVAMAINTLMKKYKPKKLFNHLYFAFSVLVAGFVLQNDRIGLIPVKGVDLWEVIVALVLVYIGIKLIFFNSKNGHGVRIEVNTDDDNDDDDDESTSDGNLHSDGEGFKDAGSDEGGKDAKRKGVFISTGGDHEQFIGDMRLGDSAWSPESGSYNVNIGDMKIDFTTAIFNEGETTIDLSCWVGDIDVILPDDLPVDLYMESNVGEVVFTGHAEKSGVTRNTIKFRSQGYDEAPKKLKLKAALNVGSIKVRRV